MDNHKLSHGGVRSSEIMLTVEKINESWIKLIGDYDDKRMVSDYFTRFVPNYMFHPSTRRGSGMVEFASSA